MLDTTPASVNSALQRARARSTSGCPRSPSRRRCAALGDDEVRALVERYVDAWERGDVDAVVAMLADDATFSMPPNAGGSAGARRSASSCRAARFDPAPLRPRDANGQLAFGTYKLIDGEWLPNAHPRQPARRGGRHHRHGRVPRHLAVRALRAPLTPPATATEDKRGVPIDGGRKGSLRYEASRPLRRPVDPARNTGRAAAFHAPTRTRSPKKVAISPPAPRAGAPLSPPPGRHPVLAGP